MTYELRILSGLHRGATLPLDENPVEIGARDEAGVVLVDPGIEANHATLRREADGWILAAQDGSLHTAEDNSSKRELVLERDCFVRIGDVWVTIAKEGDLWLDPPPIPAPSAADAETIRDTPSVDPEGENPADTDVSSAGAAVDGNNKKSSSSNPHLLWILSIPFALIALLSVGAYAITSKTSSAVDVKKVNILGDLNGKSRSTIKAGEASKPAEAEAGTPANNNPADEKLRAAFRKRLSDAQLIQRFDLDLEARSWKMRAQLDDAETTRFERVLAGFVHENRITFPVDAKVVTAEGMLPFKIRQVISGANASIITLDGTRLYVGDEYEGIRVVSIKANNLIFAGKRKIEVNW